MIYSCYLKKEFQPLMGNWQSAISNILTCILSCPQEDVEHLLVAAGEW